MNFILHSFDILTDILNHNNVFPAMHTADVLAVNLYIEDSIMC